MSNYPIGLTEWQQEDDPATIWLVSAYWPEQLGSVIGSVCVAVPKSEWDGTTEAKRDKVVKFFQKLERKEDNITRTKVTAMLNSLPNDINLHVYFCKDESTDQTGSLTAGNVATGRPALEPIPSPEE